MAYRPRKLVTRDGDLLRLAAGGMIDREHDHLVRQSEGVYEIVEERPGSMAGVRLKYCPDASRMALSGGAQSNPDLRWMMGIIVYHPDRICMENGLKPALRAEERCNCQCRLLGGNPAQRRGGNGRGSVESVV